MAKKEETKKESLVKISVPEYYAYSLIELNGTWSVVKVPVDLALVEVIASNKDIYVAQESFRIAVENELL